MVKPTTMIFYCPNCGEESDMEPWVWVCPATVIERCPRCGALWRIEIQFFEVEGIDAQ